MNEVNKELYSDFDTQLTPEEMEQDWIEWDDDLRKEVQEFLDADDKDPGYRDEDRWYNTPEGWAYV